jgi:hypothetical protein
MAQVKQLLVVLRAVKKLFFTWCIVKKKHSLVFSLHPFLQMVWNISKGDKEFGCEWKARIAKVKTTIGDGEILDACICIQKGIRNRPFPTSKNIDKAKAKAANCKDILGKEAFAIAGI